MGVETQNTIISLVVLAAMLLAAAVVTALFCHFRVARKKPASYGTIFIGASVVPLLLAIVATFLEPDIWWSREHKSSPEDFLIMLGLFGVMCALPAFGVVLYYKRRSKRDETRVV